MAEIHPFASGESATDGATRAIYLAGCNHAKMGVRMTDATSDKMSTPSEKGVGRFGSGTQYSADGETIEPLEFPSINDVITTYQQRRSLYRQTRADFEKEYGKIFEDYFARSIHAGAFLVGKRARWRPGRFHHRIVLAYDSSRADPRLDEVLRNIRTEERQSAVLLAGRAYQVFVQMAYALIVCLLNTLDSACTPDGQHQDAAAVQARVKAAIESAEKELLSIKAFSDKAARRAALGLYLVGLPLGAVIGALLVFATSRSVTIDMLTDNGLLAACLASGAIGAVISVMARINSGRRLDVDYEKGRVVALLAGSFRPIIGAVFGGVLYVLVVGGLLPLATPATTSAPTPAETEQIALFFVGLAFVAGFTERWAQDTIVSSAPKVTTPSKDTSQGPGRP